MGSDKGSQSNFVQVGSLSPIPTCVRFLFVAKYEHEENVVLVS